MTYQFSTDEQISLALDISRQPIAPRRESLEDFIQWLKDPPYTKLYMIFVDLAKKSANITSENQWLALSALSPWQGITPAPATFASMSPADRRRFMANAMVIASANGMVNRSEDAFELARQRLSMAEENLEWCIPGIGDCDPGSPDGISPAGPMIVHHPDIRAAFKRLLVLKAPKESPGTPARSTAPPRKKKKSGSVVGGLVVLAGLAIALKGLRND